MYSHILVHVEYHAIVILLFTILWAKKEFLQKQCHLSISFVVLQIEDVVYGEPYNHCFQETDRL